MVAIGVGDPVILAQADRANPVDGWYPTSRWRPGEIVRDSYLLPVPGWLVPVRIALMAIALILTVATGVDYVVRALRLRAAAKATA